MPKVYLTIDDSPSERFADLVDFLAEREIPAAFFCRGDLLEKRPNPAALAIQKGFVIGNHGYSHERASENSFEEICADILRADKVVAAVYAQAGVKRPGKYFRFPYLDRGMGACLVEPEGLSAEHMAAHHDLLQTGLGNEPLSPQDILLCKIERGRQLQAFLKEEGFEPLPMPGVKLSWYAQTEMASAVDSLCTFSTSDWALTERHKGKHGFGDIEDLKRRIDEDPGLQDESSNHIILAHDQAEIYEVTTALIEHFLDRGFEFLDFPADKG